MTGPADRPDENSLDPGGQQAGGSAGLPAGADPGMQPETDPGTQPGAAPGTQSGAAPGTEPEADPGSEPGAEPEADPEAEAADQRRRVDRATRGTLAALLCLEAFVVLLVPRAIAQTAQGLSTTTTLLLVGLAVLLVASGFLLRRSWGIGLGSALQVLLVVTALLIPVLVVVLVLFLLLWWYVLRTRHQLLATPSGWRMLIS